MSILVKGMEMPNKCEECPLFDGKLGGCGVTNYFILRKWGKGKPDWCPLVEVVMPNIIHWLNDIEIVRCKDCKWWDNHDGGERCTNEVHLSWAKPENFCNYGERK